MVNYLRIKKGLSYKFKLIIRDGYTIMLNTSGEELFNEPNEFIYLNNGKKNKIFSIGNPDKENEIGKKFGELRVYKKNFIKDFDDLETNIDDFWYQFITYYLLKSKRKTGMSAFKIASVSVHVDVTSKVLKEKIKSGLTEAMKTKKPKFYNILDIN